MYHSFLIHSSTDGHLGCFQHLAIVNSTAMNTGVHWFFWTGVSGFLGYIPSKGITGQKAVPFLLFWGNSILFSTLAVPVCIPINSAWGFPFLRILIDTCFLLIYWWQPFWQVWGDLIVVLICIFVMVSNVEYLYLCLLVIWMPSLNKYLLRSFAHFLNWVVCFLGVRFSKLFLYFGI